MASGHSITNEELKAKNAELQEKLRLVKSEKSEIQLNVKELKMKLERDKILLPQVRDCSPRGCESSTQLGPWSRNHAGYREGPAKSWKIWVLVLIPPYNHLECAKNLQIVALPGESEHQG